MDKFTLQAEVREGRGKGPARRLRAAGKIPGVFYGAQVEPQRLAVSPKDLTKILSSEHGRNSVIELHIGNETKLSMVRDLQIDPVRRDLIHADFYRIFEDKAVNTTVPFRTKGRAAGVVMGGELQVVFHELPIRSVPGAIPTHIEVDVSPMNLHDIFHVRDLQLPQGVEVTLPGAQTLIHVQAERRRGDAADDAGAAAEGAEAAKDDGEAAAKADA